MSQLLCKARVGQHEATGGIVTVILKAVFAKGEYYNKRNISGCFLHTLDKLVNSFAHTGPASAAVDQMHGCRSGFHFGFKLINGLVS